MRPAPVIALTTTFCAWISLTASATGHAAPLPTAPLPTAPLPTAPLPTAPLPKNIELLPPLRLEHSRVSPDGRWLVGSQMKAIEAAYFYDFKLKRSFAVGALDFSSHDKSDQTEYAVNDYFWRDDSRVCAVSDGLGWRHITPGAQRVQSIPRLKPSSCADWSSQNQLMVFEEPGKAASYRVWNGQRLSKAIDWGKATGFPYPAELRPWDCEVSPSGQWVALRFYGHAMREKENAGHMGVFDTKTLHSKWGAEVNRPRWIDNSRLMFEDNDDGYDQIVGLSTLTVGKTGPQQWLKDVVGWTLTRDRKAVWAVTEKGDLMRSPTARKAWKTVRRGVFTPQTFSQERLKMLTLTLSPRGDMAALTYRYASRNLLLFSTSAQKPWTLNWKASSGLVQLVGWRSGKSLPLVEWYGQEEGKARVGQILR